MKHKILIIDDSKDILFAISEFFLLKDWEVYTALSIKEALKIVSRKKLDIIIIDYHMPYINGVTGVKLIRKINASAPIIALTIEGLENIAEEFFEAGADDFAIKPIKILDLYSRVQVHLRNNKKENTMEIGKISPLDKGINYNTLSLIKKFLLATQDYITTEEIAESVGLAEKTVNRYMNYFVKQGQVLVKINYGKIGRPKNQYLWNKESKI